MILVITDFGLSFNIPPVNCSDLFWLNPPEVEDLESVIKDELQTTAAAADWPMPTTVTRSQKTVLESRRKGRNGKQSGIRHERGGGRRGRGRGRRQGKNGGKGDATKIITAAGYRKQSSDLVKQKLSIDSGEKWL